jgi:glycosyltransferase involved in cell wall biosynthesis
MRLTVFGPGHPFRGGIARATTEMVRELDSRGHDVRFLTPRRQYPWWLYPGTSDRDPDSCADLACATAVLDPLNPWAWSAGRRAARAHAADAWIFPYWTWAWAGLWWSLLRDRRRPPAVAVVHNPADHDAKPWQRFAARRVLGASQALFTHARALAAGLGDAFPSKPVGFAKLPAVGRMTPPDAAASRAALGLPDHRRVALFVGLIRPYKGVDLLVEAAAELPPDSDWLVVIAGEPWGGLGDRLRRQVESLGLGDRVRLDLRWIPESELSGLLAAADLAVLPYRRGSQSAVAPMALAHGTPVLTTAVGGVPEIVRNDVNGVVVEPGSPAALAAALQALDRDRLRVLARGARDTASDDTWAAYVTALEGLLVRLA